MDDTDVINFLLSTEIIPLCLRTMEIGSELSKTVATFIVQKILLDDVGDGGARELGKSEVKGQPMRAAACVRTFPNQSRLLPLTAWNHLTSHLQVGLNYICATAERFFAVGAVLGNMVVAQAQAQEQPSQRLLKHIIRCYLRLSDNPRCDAGAPGNV